MKSAIETILALSDKLSNYTVEESSEELDKLRRKYKVPTKDGKTFNRSTGMIAGKLRSAGLDRGKWIAPGSQRARYSALSKAGCGNWKCGFLMVEDGNLKYPFISASGKAMVSGIYAAKRRAVQSGETAVVDITNKVLKLIEKDLERKKKAKK